MLDILVYTILILAARYKACATFSKIAVETAIKCKPGAVFLGSNIENRSFAPMVYAERIAIGAAVAGGERDFVAIAVTSNSDEPIGPCGACRQFLAELNLDVVIVSRQRLATERLTVLRAFPRDQFRRILKHADLS